MTKKPSLEQALDELESLTPNGWQVRIQRALDGKWWADLFLVEKGVHETPEAAIRQLSAYLRAQGRLPR